MFQTPGPTPRMSQTVSTVRSFSRVGLLIARAKSRAVRGSVQVALLSDVGHEQVVLDEPDHELGLLLFEAEARREPFGDLGADGRVVAARALADVVEEEGDVEDATVDARSRISVEIGRSSISSALDLGEGRDRSDNVLVHRVVMVHVELGSRVQLIILAQAMTVLVAPFLGAMLLVIANNPLMSDLRNRWWQNLLGGIGFLAILATSGLLVARLTGIAG